METIYRFAARGSTDFRSDQTHKMACAKPRHNPVADFFNLKRKRTDSDVLKSKDIASPPTKIQVLPKPLQNGAPTAHSASHSSQDEVKKQSSSSSAVNVDSHIDFTKDLQSTQPETKKIDAQTTGGLLEKDQPPSNSHGSDVKMDSSKLAKAVKKIEAQFNLEILLKHKEQRLIEQELAKCQIALEQIRRCTIIPFPSEMGLSENVSLGIGPALAPQSGFSRPPRPAPWGVTDGPYTRHYSRWLIPDPEFDSSPIYSTQSARVTSGGKTPVVDGRSARGIHDAYQPPPSARSQRQSAGSKLQSLNTTFAQPKQKTPLLFTRETDGVTVKLVCVICRKEDSNSVQGFLNHCRIAHGKNYESHSAAAIECGVELTPGELERINQQSRTQFVEPPPPSPSVFTPVTARHTVNPLIMDAPNAKFIRSVSTSVQPTPMRSSQVQDTSITRSGAGTNDTISHASKANLGSGPFKASAQTPHLSKFLEKRGITGNLEKLVTSVKIKTDIDAIECIYPDLDGETPTSASKSSSQSKPIQQVPAMHLKPASSSTSSVPSKRAGPTNSRNEVVPAKKTKLQTKANPQSLITPSNSSPVVTAQTAEQDFADTDMHDSAGLSPHTVDTNPGLVTDIDDEDDEHESEARSETDSTYTGSLRRQDRVRVRGGIEDELREDQLPEASEVKSLNQDQRSTPLIRQSQVPTIVVATQPSGINSNPAVASHKKKRGRPSKKDSLKE